jgi:phosphohistidine phosphatase
MPRLILLRHATAERAGPRQPDHDRALTKGGRKEATKAGLVLKERGEAVDLVLSSDSRRTRQTWEGVEPEIDARPEVRFMHALFEAPDYLPILKSEARKAATVLLIGHNPAMHGTAVEVAASLAGRDGARLRSGFQKGALAIFDFGGEWTALRPGQMRLVAYIDPEEE